jgi:hypothetical protein
MKNKINSRSWLKRAIILLPIIAVSTALNAIEPVVKDNIATYDKSGFIGTKKVDPKWKEIVIKKNVTLTGRFEALNRNADLIIRGESQTTSVIKGRSRENDALSSDKAGINKSGGGKLTVKNLNIVDQPGRGIMGWGGQLTVQYVSISNTVDPHWCDGIHASDTGNIESSYINVSDDGTYTTMCDDITKVTFIHNQNGAPIQIAWGQHTGGGNEKRISDCKFKANLNKKDDYNCGTIDWKRSQVKNDSIKLKFTNCSRSLASTTMKQPYCYNFGNWNGTEIVDNGTIKVKGWSSTVKTSEVRQRPNSKGTVKTY